MSETQSVCKHCGKEITPCMSPNRTSVNPCKGWIHARDGWHTCAGKYAEPVAEPASTLKGLDPELYEQAANRVVELHEPASAGEPQSCPCPCHKGESVICNCGGGFECEYINSIPAARPSEPSAPHTSAEPTCGKPAASLIPRWGMSWACALPPNHEGECAPGGNCVRHGKYICKPNEQPQCPKWPDCISAAAPQPVSGDAPDSATFGSVTCNNAVEPLIEPDEPSPMIFAPKLAGDAPKVEEIARKLHLYHCQERRSGSMCPCHAVADGMTEGCHCKEETADIAAILRPYFPASQLVVRCHTCKSTLIYKRLRDNEIDIYHTCNPLAATPASTARTDALAKLRADGWMVAVHNDYRVNGKFHTFWLLTRVGREGQFVKGEGETDEDALAQIVRQLASHAAPGSVPQAEPPKEEKR